MKHPLQTSLWSLSRSCELSWSADWPRSRGDILKHPPLTFCGRPLAHMGSPGAPTEAEKLKKSSVDALSPIWALLGRRLGLKSRESSSRAPSRSWELSWGADGRRQAEKQKKGRQFRTSFSNSFFTPPEPPVLGSCEPNSLRFRGALLPSLNFSIRENIEMAA